MRSAAAGERGQALILLAMWLFFGGGAASALFVYEHPVAEMRKAVEQLPEGGSRKAAILADIKQWEAVQKGQNEKVAEQRKQLLQALRRKDTQRSALDPMLAELDKSFLVMDWDFLNLRFRVKEQVSAADWAKIASPDKR
jgi:hypothetical protein